MDDDLLDVDSEDEVDDDDNDDDENSDNIFFGSNNNSDDTDSNEESVINKYLRRLQEEYKGCTIENPPLPYQNKTFWVYQPMPSFSLKESSDVNNLYIPRVFLWLPEYFMNAQEKLKCQKCNCEIKSNGFNTKTRARKIIDFEE